MGFPQPASAKRMFSSATSIWVASRGSFRVFNVFRNHPATLRWPNDFALWAVRTKCPCGRPDARTTSRRSRMPIVDRHPRPLRAISRDQSATGDGLGLGKDKRRLHDPRRLRCPPLSKSQTILPNDLSHRTRFADRPGAQWRGSRNRGRSLRSSKSAKSAFLALAADDLEARSAPKS